MHPFATFVISLISFIATMRAATPVATGLSARGFSGFILPANLSGGTYQVTRDANGQELHVLLSADLEVRALALSYALTVHKRRTPSEIFCGCGFDVNHANCDNAMAGLKDQVGSGGKTIPSSAAWYTIADNVVAFVCTTAEEGGEFVTSGELESEAADITSTCGAYVAGAYVAGTYWRGNWGPYNSIYLWNFGFMQYYSGEDFCGNAAGSSHHSC